MLAYLLAVFPICCALVPEISLKSTPGVAKWPSYGNSTSRIVKAGVVYIHDNVTTRLIDVVDPDPSESVITKKPRKWKQHSAKTSKKHFWSKNDVLGSTPPPLIPAVCDSLASTCPPYRMLERRREYEVRWYPSHKWASAIVMSEDDRLLAFWEGLAKLQDYLDGHNDQSVPMNLSYPLLTQVNHGRHPGVLNPELRDITISASIPARHQMNPPVPVSSDVLVDALDSSTIFVQAFRARIWDLTERSLRHRVERLMTTLRNHGEAFHDKYYYLASYTKPDNTDYNVYELWIHATRHRDPGRVKPTPMVKSRDPPLNKVTSRTRKRLCRGVECPPFDVLRVYKFGIQKRRYFDTVLASASTTECEFNSLSVWRGFMPLHLYKHGINSHWEVLEATRPIGIVHLVDKAPEQSLLELFSGNKTSLCKHNMTVSLYLPQRLHSNPPSAGLGAPAVKIDRVNDLIVYVQTVGGSILEPVRSAIEVRKFGSRLKQLGLCFKTAEYYLVIYDFMVRFHGRQNEIWFVADRCSKEASTVRGDMKQT